jgi:hypothetical protein
VTTSSAKPLPREPVRDAAAFSNSSMNRMHGDFLRASANSFLTFCVDSPTYCR